MNYSIKKKHITQCKVVISHTVYTEKKLQKHTPVRVIDVFFGTKNAVRLIILSGGTQY